MFNRAPLLAAALVVPALVACGAVHPLSVATAPTVSTAASFAPGTAVQDSHLGGTRSASFNVTAQTSSYITQAIVHRWTKSDVDHYVLTLYGVTNQVKNQDGTIQSENDTELTTVTVRPDQAGAFSHLLVNTLYKVAAAAYAVDASGQPIQINKNDTAAFSEFEFNSGTSNNNDVNDQITNCTTGNFYNALVVHLDNTPFDGTATVGTSQADGMTVVDGQYTAPTQPISATAVDDPEGSSAETTTTGATGDGE